MVTVNMVMGHQLTVAEAAAVINVAIVIIKLVYPMLIAVVVASILSKQTNAATWSVLGRLINASHWPTLLGTDTANAKKVSKRVRLLAIYSALCGLVLAITAAVTPLGLHSELFLEDSNDTSFTYAEDTSAIGRATRSHATYRANRICGGLPSISCPGNDDHIDTVFFATGANQTSDPGYPNAHITTGISENITTAFTSATGRDKSTVAGIFDIEYRSFINYNNQTEPEDDTSLQWLDGGKPRTQGRFRYYQSFILEERLQPIEGLIVSTTEYPGIGFRNHTLPPSSEYGYTWTEKILWLEPETACTNLNLTYDYTMPPPDSFDGVPNERLTDRGGFVNLTHDYPYLDLNNTQRDPALLAKSWKGAVLTNYILSMYMNVSRNDSYLGKEFLIDDYRAYDSFSNNVAPNKIAFSPFGYADLEIQKYSPNLPGRLADLYTTDYNISRDVKSDDFQIDTAVFGYGGGDPLNITTAGSGGGIMLGAASKLDADGTISTDFQSYTLDPGTNWSHPIYSCVSSVKASVKTVQFRLNGTDFLSNLAILNVSDTTYSSASAMPIWATENPHQKIFAMSPFWGIVSPEQVDNSGLSTIQKPSLYLPAGKSATGVGTLDAADAAAGAAAPLSVYTSIYSTIDDNLPDFSGVSNWLLYSKWLELGSQSSTAGKVTDYIWTDLMANMLVGTKSPLSEKVDSTDSSPVADLPAMRYALGLSYDWRYAIPAFVFVAMFLPLVLGSVILFCTRKLSLNGLKSLLNQTAAGRSMTTERYQGQGTADYANTREWVEIRGDELFNPYPNEQLSVGFNNSDYTADETGKSLFCVDEASVFR